MLRLSRDFAIFSPKEQAHFQALYRAVLYALQ